MADPQVLELGRIVSSTFASVFFRTLIPIMLIIGFIDILIALFRRKKKRNRRY